MVMTEYSFDFFFYFLFLFESSKFIYAPKTEVCLSAGFGGQDFTCSPLQF